MRRSRAISLCGAILASLALAACGTSGSGGDYGAKPPDYTALKGAPAPLSGLYRQPSFLLPGDLDGFESRLSSLEGHPVVVNVWASWCGPCRAEFPYFQQAAAKLGKRVAFLGVDSYDSSPAAKTFLGEYPVPYPSYSDPDRSIWESLDMRGLPATAFYDSSGKLTYLKQGGYFSLADLRADITSYTG